MTLAAGARLGPTRSTPGSAPAAGARRTLDLHADALVADVAARMRLESTKPGGCEVARSPILAAERCEPGAVGGVRGSDGLLGPDERSLVRDEHRRPFEVDGLR